jgi:hypothetical protein
MTGDQETDDASENGPLPNAPDADAAPAQPWQRPVRRHRWLARIVGVAALAVPALIAVNVVLSATGGKDDQTVDHRLVDALRYDGEGHPLVRAPNANVGAVRRREWRVCGQTCDRVSGHAKVFRPGGVLAGSRVEVRVVGAGREATVVTPGWDGQLTALRRPTLHGRPQVGSVVGATAGKWTGGWIGAATLVGLRACPTKQSSGRCVALTGSILAPGRKAERTIPSAFRGWWIGAIEWNVPPGRRFDDADPGDPADPKGAQRAPTVGATVVAGPLQGPVR